jgi:hypothetical protein
VPSIIQFLDRGDDRLDIRLSGVRLHYDNHVKNPLRTKNRIVKPSGVDYIRMERASKV